MVNEKKIDAVKEQVSPFRIWDIAVLVIFAILLAVTLYLIYGKNSEKGERVIITHLGTATEYTLSENREIEIEDKLIVCIENGSVYIKDAKCKDKICEKSGTIKRVNETIVCAPQNITVRIAGKSADGNKVVTG